MIDMMFLILFGPEGPKEDNAKRVFREHYNNVRKIVPKEKLLGYDIKEGWGLPCEFLGVPVPTIINEDKEVDMSIPHINEAQSFGDRLDVLKRRPTQRVAKRYAPVIGVAVIGAGAWVLRSIWRR